MQSLHASAVEVYHEAVFDLMDDRAQLSVGANTKQLGTRTAGKADIGGSGANRRTVNGRATHSLLFTHVFIRAFKT